jgi:D-amino-acid oxidase
LTLRFSDIATEVLILRRAKDVNIPPGQRLSDDLFDENPWWKSLFDDFRQLKADELSDGIASAAELTSVCINTALYLPWLLGQCRAAGVVFRRANLKHVAEAADWGHGGKADIVVNASGILASRLGGVMDTDVIPARGQIVLVRNELEPMLSVSGTDDGAEQMCYTMMRASGGGTVLGGTYDIGNWDPTPNPDIAEKILKRVLEYHPQMKGKKMEDFDIIRHGVGLRPYRKGGVRMEKESIEGVWVVHNYGHSGWGYQASYGCAERVLELVDEVILGKSTV